MKRMLLVFAHPDDESFAVGGTVAKYVRAGWQADLICATLGEAGSKGPYANATTDTLGSIRRKELEAAGTTLGISTLTFLGYADGKLASQNSGELEDPVYKKMHELKPDVVITYDTTGVSNHPDHIRMSYVATYAYQKYVKVREAYPQNRQEWSLEDAQGVKGEPKLYYACVPQSAADYLKIRKIIPVESFGKPWTGTPDKYVTTVIDIKRFSGLKVKALCKHATQKEDVDRFLSLPTNPMLRQEYFILRMRGTHEVFMGKNDRVADRL